MRIRTRLEQPSRLDNSPNLRGNAGPHAALRRAGSRPWAASPEHTRLAAQAHHAIPVTDGGRVPEPLSNCGGPLQKGCHPELGIMEKFQVLGVTAPSVWRRAAAATSTSSMPSSCACCKRKPCGRMRNNWADSSQRSGLQWPPIPGVTQALDPWSAPSGQERGRPSNAMADIEGAALAAGCSCRLTGRPRERREGIPCRRSPSDTVACASARTLRAH